MRSNFQFILALLISSFVFNTKANGDVVFSIDMDTSMPGIQSTREVSEGTVFNIGLFMQITGNSTVSTFFLGVDFDPSLVMISAISTSGRPAGFEQTSTVVSNEILGQVRVFEAFNLFSAPSLNSSFAGYIGEMTINAGTPTLTSLASFMPDFQVVGIDGVLNATDQQLPRGITPGDGGVFFVGSTLSVTAVPEPASLSLLGIVLVAGVARRHRSRRTKATKATKA